MTGPAVRNESVAAPPTQVAVRLIAWGATAADVENAVRWAQMGPARELWDFAEIERLIGWPCPLPMDSPAAIADEVGNQWAYVAYSAGRADG